MPAITVPEAARTFGDFYVPRFEITAGGAAIPSSVLRDVVQVTYNDSTTEIDSFDITVNNWDATERRFKYVGSETNTRSTDPLHTLFDPCARDFELKLGYGSEMYSIVKGSPASIEPTFPAELVDTSAMWKIYGRSADDAWIVGTNGKTVRWDGSTLTQVSAGIGESLFTVHADAERFTAVGGFGTGLILENTDGTWKSVGPQGTPGFVGVATTSDSGFAVGQDGAVFSRGAEGWTEEELGFNVDETFHSVWIDPDDGVWVVGGQVQTLPLVDGIVLYSGSETLGEL